MFDKRLNVNKTYNMCVSNNTDVELRKPPTHDTKEETL